MFKIRYKYKDYINPHITFTQLCHSKIKNKTTYSKTSDLEQHKIEKCVWNQVNTILIECIENVELILSRKFEKNKLKKGRQHLGYKKTTQSKQQFSKCLNTCLITYVFCSIFQVLQKRAVYQTKNIFLCLQKKEIVSRSSMGLLSLLLQSCFFVYLLLLVIHMLIYYLLLQKFSFFLCESYLTQL